MKSVQQDNTSRAERRHQWSMSPDRGGTIYIRSCVALSQKPAKDMTLLEQSLPTRPGCVTIAQASHPTKAGKRYMTLLELASSRRHTMRELASSHKSQQKKKKKITRNWAVAQWYARRLRASRSWVDSYAFPRFPTIRSGGRLFPWRQLKKNDTTRSSTSLNPQKERWSLYRW